jgi:hypothetical protein
MTVPGIGLSGSKNRALSKDKVLLEKKHIFV